ncbi:glucose-1-phosphate adenylyltransferase large subunit 1-like [Ipomoea triloba]|uniref:glucose-1-phosphate adenylyltransferase large subunit 1-like n=1 Tax=Ipomoea triloba TaxID=35885 RepID=UPI00125DDE1E|nr:glucose-1-phosphate adenylyltransferase large subunit 1-like [Ipomoea triloba]
MEARWVTLKSTAHLPRESKFWGNRMGRSPNSLRVERKEWKIKLPGVAFSALTTEHGNDALAVELEAPRPRANSKNVAAIILGGGAGSQLFPLTRRAATPAIPVGGCYRMIDIPMSNCINSGISKVFVLTQFNSASLNRHIARTYFGNGVSFGDGFFEVLAATQTPGEAGKKWFQGTADAVRKFTWVFEDVKNKDIDNILILSGDQLYRMDYMNLVQNHIDCNSDITISCVPTNESRAPNFGLVKMDHSGRVVQFVEKPKGIDLKEMQMDTTLLGLSSEEARRNPFIASMGIYVFRTELLLNLLGWKYPAFNDFGSEIIPATLTDHRIQAYIFRDYWEDIGTIKSFYDANLALTEQSPKFEFYDPKTPIYTSPRFLPPSKIDRCKIKDAIISHGCFLRDCTVEHSIVGERSRLDSGVELKDTLMMGADNYETESEIALLLAGGKVSMGIGQNTKIRNCIIDKNVRVGKNVVITNKDGVEEAARPEEGFYIRSGIVVIMENATISDGTVI